MNELEARNEETYLSQIAHNCVFTHPYISTNNFYGTNNFWNVNIIK